MSSSSEQAEAEPATRELTVRWQDPLASAGQLAGLSGLEAMQKIVAGDIPRPPISALLDFGVIEVEHGRAVFFADPGEQHYNPIGVVHGGLAATLLDSAMGCAVHTTLEAGVAYTTLELKVNLVRAIRAETGRIVADGRVIHRGGKVATVEGKLTSAANGKLLAHETSTCLVIDNRDAAPASNGELA